MDDFGTWTPDAPGAESRIAAASPSDHVDEQHDDTRNGSGDDHSDTDDDDHHHDHDHGPDDHDHGDEYAPHGYPGAERVDTAGQVLDGPGNPEGAVIESTVRLDVAPTNGLGVSFGNTFKLHSLPTSNYKVYLDFDGHSTTGTPWNSYFGATTFYSPAFSLDASESFNEAELSAIQQIWQRVAEFFSPFNIDVTTEDPGAAGLTYSGAGDTAFGIRAVITDEGGKNWGGLGYVGSFDWSSDTPVFVYANMLGDNTHYVSVATTHEIGHSLGLAHDGQGGNEYYYGHSGWAPTMGVGYYSSVVQWSKGEYTGATNTQDDLAIITTTNSGVTYRADDVGNTIATAAALGGTVDANGIATVQRYGIISGSGANNDIDMYSFTVAQGGSINLTVSAASQVFVSGSATPTYTALPLSMLDTALSLFDQSGNRIASFDSPTRQDGVITANNLAAGTYYLAIDGVGWGTPSATTPTGWTEYGSLGQYMVSGTYTQSSTVVSRPPPQLTVDRTDLTTTEAGGAGTMVLKVLNGVGDVTVDVSGLDATEGRLSASSVLLNAANNWTASLTVTGVQDRDVDGAQSYALNLASAGFSPLSVNVRNLDDDIAVSSGGAAGTYTPTKGRPSEATSTNATVASVSTDDGVVQTVTETNKAPYLGMEWRWNFTGLAGGDQKLQLDARSTGEAVRFEYSTDGALSWKAFGGAPASATEWNGDFLATGVADTMWVRVVDMMRTSDMTRDSVSVDLMTLSPAGLPATAAATDHLFA